jgi:hypothetical protein
MSERAFEERWSRASDVVSAAFWSILALLFVVGWVYVPA